MTIYIDSDYKVHLTDDGTMTAVETDVFDGKCKEWIESYRFVPTDATWTRGDGVQFSGMVAPWKDLMGAYAAQTAYLDSQNAEYEAALTAIEAALEVTV